ncbi:MAG: CoA transferase [Dehalococcoidales bacterium]|nr:CoA transferase [Dehalococcoidales bacterium]
MAGVLDGIKVISMEHWTMVPLASAYLADWGADVIKIEPPGGEQSRGLKRAGGVETRVQVGSVEVDHYFQFVNRNKKSLAIDLKKETGRDILCQLVKQADVFMHNYELNAVERLRLDYDNLSKVNPGLVYATLTGYGSKGPDKDEQAFDNVASWARGGLAYLMITDPELGPPTHPHGMGDRNASVHMVAGVLGALLHKERTGKGQQVEFCLYHTTLWSMSRNIQAALSGAPEDIIPRIKQKNALHIPYRTKDNRWIMFAMSQSDRYWPDFCKALGMPELENDPRFNNMDTRGKNSEELIHLLDKVFATRTVAEWSERCRQQHLIFSPIQTPAEVITDPQAQANDFFVDLPHPAGAMKILASPTKFHQNPASVRSIAPEVGQNTEEILLELGYSWEDIAGLKDQEVIP